MTSKTSSTDKVRWVLMNICDVSWQMSNRGREPEKMWTFAFCGVYQNDTIAEQEAQADGRG